jgi:hypothetical protein
MRRGGGRCHHPDWWKGCIARSGPGALWQRDASEPRRSAYAADKTLIEGEPVKENYSRCHAVGKEADSPHKGTPLPLSLQPISHQTLPSRSPKGSYPGIRTCRFLRSAPTTSRRSSNISEHPGPIDQCFSPPARADSLFVGHWLPRSCHFGVSINGLFRAFLFNYPAMPKIPMRERPNQAGERAGAEARHEK